MESLINKARSKLSIFNMNYNKEKFGEISCFFALRRLRIISIFLLIMAIPYFYIDLVSLKGVNDTIFRLSLVAVHITFTVMSIGFFIIYPKIINDKEKIKLSKIIIRFYVFIYLFGGAVTSINSQRLTGNIDAYIVDLLIIAVVFPIEPVFMFFSFILNHIFFIIGLALINRGSYLVVSKQINSTTMLVAAVVFCYSLYRSRVKDFINKSKLCESESNFRKLFDVNPSPMIISRFHDGKIVATSDRAHVFFGYSKEEFKNIYANELYVDKADRILMLNKLNNFMRVEDYIVEQKSSSGDKKWVIANYEIVEYMGEKCILTNVTDITELKKMEKELLTHASIDILTGVLNRRKGIEYLSRILDLKESNKISSICFIDIDGLKYVNDHYGHNEGDYLINTVCKVIKDTIDTKDIIFRFGGDEFIIVFPEKSEIEAEKIWIKIENKFNEINDLKLKPYSIKTSHGLIEFSSNTNLSIDELLGLADKKMYIEKKQHKNSSR